jgi:DNA-binding MarR family transcriptional regulator
LQTLVVANATVSDAVLCCTRTRLRTATPGGTTSTIARDTPAPATTTAATGSGLTEGWYGLLLLHGRIEAHVERALRTGHELSMREFALLDVLSRQVDGEDGHLRMTQVADAVALSQSATTRLVTRLEDRGLLARCLCPTDRRGIYTDVSPSGLGLLAEARPTHDVALREALDEAREDPRLTALVDTVEALGARG